MIKIDGLHFQPWIGKEYESNDRLLLLGESHYIDEEAGEEDDFSKGYDDLTIKVIQNHLAGEDMKTPFFKKIGLLFYPDNPQKIWSEVAFANAIQIGFPNASSQPGAKEIATIAPAFKLLLTHLKPKRVLVLSRRMWNYWIPEDGAQFLTGIEKKTVKSQLFGISIIQVVHALVWASFILHGC